MKKKRDMKFVKLRKVLKMLLYTLILCAVLFSLVYVIVDHYKNTNYQISNLASKFCIDNGGTLEIKDSSEGQYGICVFDDETKCKEWDFYNEDCSKGDSIYLTLEEYYSAIDTSCHTVDDCEIKDVRNCCGEFPKCVNKNFEVASPEFVAKRCELEGLFSSCGFVAFQSCECVDNNCIAHH